MRFPLRTPLALTAATVGVVAAAIAAPAAMAAPATIAWDNGSDTTSSINQGEAVTWDVQGGGHNVDVYQGPETFKSTSGKDPVGTQYSHAFNKPGTYKFICDYHSSMKGTITVAAVQAQPAPAAGSPSSPSSAPTSAGSTAQPTSGAPAAGPAGAAATNSAIDGAAPAVAKPSFSRNVLRVRLSEAAKLTVRYVKTGTKAHTVVTRKLTAKQGLNTFSVRRWMRPGSYRVSMVAMDAAGNVSKTVRLKLTVRR